MTSVLRRERFRGAGAGVTGGRGGCTGWDWGGSGWYRGGAVGRLPCIGAPPWRAHHGCPGPRESFISRSILVGESLETLVDVTGQTEPVGEDPGKSRRCRRSVDVTGNQAIGQQS